ncbi:MarR family winged helix-turn-helix transcriptional regulator [Amycolatopsis mediterranei]|uniref:MarR family winged helix-turn-helix transcriptional regulator n=1 Tax=Amycolatopsis mediterranei TaxID=33910 RepID=UPI00343C4324
MERLSEDEARLWHAWKRASDTVRARIGDDLATATGLSDPEFGILTRLEDLGRGVLRQSELATSMGWHRSRLSHQLTRMEQRGLVTRDSASGTGVTVSITDAGRTMIATARPVHAQSVKRHLLAQVPTDELARMTAILEALTAPRNEAP